MNLLELPLDLVLNIIALAVQSGEIVVILRLRQVNRLFDREITRYLVLLRLRDLRLHSNSNIPKSFELRLVVESVGSQYQGQNEIKIAIHAVTDDLESRLAKLKSPTNRPETLQSVCKAALAHRPLWHLFRDLLEDGESRSYRHLGEDESQDILQSSFIVAVASRYTEIQTAMLQSGVNLDFETRHFGIPLQMAARLGHSDTVKLLLDCGATIDRATKSSRCTALQKAALHGHTATVQLLLDPKYGLKTSSATYGEAAYNAVRNRHFDIATMILDKNTKLPMRLRKEICYWAAGYGYDELVVAMLDTGLDVNKVNCEASTPLAEAATGGHYSTVRLLLDRGANVRQFGKDAFVYAAGAGRIEILEMLLQRGIDMEAESRMLCAFLAATEAGNFAGVQFLLDNGLDIRSADAKIWRYRALRGAIWCNRKNVDMVRWLVLNLGVSPDGDNGDPHAAFTNTSPMATALEMGRPEIVNLLFQLGAKLIDLTDSRFTYWTQGVCMTPKQLDAFDQYHRWEEAKRYQAAGYSMDPTMSSVAQRQGSL